MITLIAMLAFPYLASWVVNALAFAKEDMDSLFGPKGFYQRLKKPPGFLANPDVFGLVWFVLYGCMGAGSYLVFLEEGPKLLPLACYAGLILSVLAYSPVFFKWKRIGWATALCVLMWIFAALSLWTFQEVNGVAGGLMVPVLIWITVVVYINWYIWRHNHKEVFSN